MSINPVTPAQSNRDRHGETGIKVRYLRTHGHQASLGAVKEIAEYNARGTDLLRAGVRQIMTAVIAGQVSHVIVEQLYRLTRSATEYQMLAALFDEHGVELVIAERPTDDELQEYLTAFAEFEAFQQQKAQG